MKTIKLFCIIIKKKKFVKKNDNYYYIKSYLLFRQYIVYLMHKNIIKNIKSAKY